MEHVQRLFVASHTPRLSVVFRAQRQECDCLIVNNYVEKLVMLVALKTHTVAELLFVSSKIKRESFILPPCQR